MKRKIGFNKNINLKTMTNIIKFELIINLKAKTQVL